ncbi:MAG: tRNA pseudouridine(38-40) synthase TruA [Sphingobacteriales bacterium]|jgi:tRNA pseudouridine38-40 synthase|nr:tRNA pseudouridine(38-40) synthase TruA [Sphingobacteriales bacterium]
MARYFLELAYKGSGYAGFQVQQNANSIQAEVEKALQVYFRDSFVLTGSSRTDAGVHARQNYFHFDYAFQPEKAWDEVLYNLNAILPAEIVLKKVTVVADDAHCRFDALSRTYEYSIYTRKDPFLIDRSYYYPYHLDIDLLQQAAIQVLNAGNFKSFAKRNSQVMHYRCQIFESEWLCNSESGYIYRVRGNRFLRGMVRGLVGTMLRVGTGKISLDAFAAIIAEGDPTKADFSVPPQGLMLMEVRYR